MFYNTTWSEGDKCHVVGPDGYFVVDKKECNYSYSRWQLSDVPCSHVISVLYYNKEKSENYLDVCNKVSTFMETYRHILNPTHDVDSWLNSDQGSIIPPEPMNKRRGRKIFLRRKEVGENIGFTNKKVQQKGSENDLQCIKCSRTQ